MPITSYAQLQTFISQTMTALGASAQFAPHGEFWNDLSYEQFVNGNVPGVPGPAVKILVVGNSVGSAFIQALRGEGIFAGPFNRMPSGGPYFTPAQIDEIAGWIDAGCPNPGA
jgi:hypothetical protein